MKDGYNTMSDEAYRQQMFDFDLQLFGGGGGGKNTGLKIIGTLAFGALGFFNPAMFGLAANGVSWGAAIMGASLFSSIWSATQRKNNNLDSSSSTVQRFERAQETMSSDGQIPVVYGRRQLTGNQTYHDTNSDANILHKHVVLCEGGIDGIESVTANELLIPTGSQTGNTVFTLQNIKYEDSWVFLKDKTLTLYTNGNARTVYLCTEDDMSSGESYWEYQVSVASLISWINRLGDGWQAFPTASTTKYPGKMWDVIGSTRTSTVWLTISQILSYGGSMLEDSFWYNGMFYEKTGNVNNPLNNSNYMKLEYKVTAYDSTNVYCNPVNFQMDTVSGGTEYTFHDGDLPDDYLVTGAYPKMAWLDMKFVISSEINGGNPSVTCLIRGRKVYDVRDGVTRYSTNPALCVRDFILSKRYGLGKWFTDENLDSDSWKEAADYCDEIIQFLDSDGVRQNAKRYELNMIIDTSRTALEWLQEMLANFCGYLVYNNGKLKLKIEKVTPISYKFDDDSCSDLKVSPLALSETPNKYEVSIIDPLNNWSTVKCICEDYADQKQRQKIITKSVNLEGVTSQNQALRLARFYRDYNLVCPMQLSFTTGMQAMHLEPGDVVTVSYHGVFKDMPIRISEIKETNKGTFEVSGRQYNDTIYGDALGGGIHWYSYSQITSPYYDSIPNVQNLVVTQQSYMTTSGNINSTVTLSWGKLSYQFLSKYSIDARLASWPDWSFQCSTSDTSCTFNVETGATYYYRVRVDNTAGRSSSGTYSDKVYITGYNAPPADVRDVTFEVTGSGINLKWTANDEPDIKGYNVYQGVGNTEFANCKLIVQGCSSNVLYVPIDVAQDYIFYVEAVDTAGNVSENPTSCFVQLDPLGDVTNFYGVKNGDTIQFFWDEIKDCNYEIKWGSSWATGKTVAKINSNVYTLFFPLVGTQVFFIKAYNGQGLYSKNATYLNINCTSEITRNIIAEFDEGTNGWQGIKNGLVVDNDSLCTQTGVITGEYYTTVKLNKKTEARNWIEYALEAGDENLSWNSINQQWQDYDGAWVNEADTTLVQCDNYISLKTDMGYLYSHDLNGNTDGASKANNVTYASGRFAQGALIADNTVIEYADNIPSVFNMSFNARMSVSPNGLVVFATMDSGSYWMRIDYCNGRFNLVDSKQQTISIDNYCHENDSIDFVIKQQASTRTFKVTNYTQNKTVELTEDFAPLGSFTELRLKA